MHVLTVEYFLEVGVCLSQGRFSKHTSTIKQPQWRRQCSKEKTKVEEEGVIIERSDVIGKDLCFETKPDYPGLEFPTQHQSVYKWQP